MAVIIFILIVLLWVIPGISLHKLKSIRMWFLFAGLCIGWISFCFLVWHPSARELSASNVMDPVNLLGMKAILWGFAGFLLLGFGVSIYALFKAGKAKALKDRRNRLLLRLKSKHEKSLMSPKAKVALMNTRFIPLP